MADETPSAAAPTPKRRGRKRKSEMPFQKNDDEVDTIPKEESISRRGRPRKKVNYYELANPENLDFPIQFPKQINYDLDNEELKNKKRKVVDQSVNSMEALPSENNSLESIEISNIANGQHEKDEENHLSRDISINSEDVGTNPDLVTSTPNNKDKKYNYTGETVKMMNRLFNLFNTGENSAQDSTNLNNSLSTSNNGKRPYRKQAKKHNVSEEEDDDGVGTITCAVCNSNMEKSLWSHHKQRYHNNLAWRLGDAPLDLNDQTFVMHTLNSLYKKKKPLYCDKCGAVKKSVVGFLSHRSQCLKSEEQLESVKIACEICGRKMLPVSMSTHIKTIHQDPIEKDKEISNKSTNGVHKALPSKRSAAKKAMKMIETVTKADDKDKYFTTNLDLISQEFATALINKELTETQFFECKFNCNSIVTNFEDAIKHLEECTEKPETGFVCKQCLTVLPSLEEIISHIELVHEINLSDGDTNDPSFVEKENNRLPSFLFTNTKRTERVLFPHAFDWTYKFCKENFSECLFQEILHSAWSPLTPDQAIKYLPKMNESCDTAHINITSFINPLEDDYTYKKYKLFESDIYDNKITLFCGGPISAMAWLPTPYTKDTENQILAVSVINSPDEKYLTDENFKVDSAIQFWNFESLQNKKYSLIQPTLAFNLVHSHGPIWHMEWCPSGCYNSDRIGLLAVTGSDSVVYIYSVPLLNEELGLYYKASPVIKLYLQRPESPLLGGLKYFASKISWSKACGHQYICVGYTNGFVALFNLKSNSVMLKFISSDNIPCILPFKSFQAHSHAITALSLYPLNDGCRWLMSASFDRKVTIWDLDKHNYPVCSMKKNIVTDGFWLTNWLCYVTSSDEGSTSTFVTTMMKQVRDYVVYDPNITLMCSFATISAVSGSDWLNGIIQANTVGEIIALFPHQILQIPDIQKVLKPKRMLFGYTYLIDKNKTPKERIETEALKKKTLQNLATKKLSGGVKLSNLKSDLDCDQVFVNEPVIYKEAEKKYALLFCDNKMRSYDDFPKNTSKQLTALSKIYANTQPNQYPLTTINKIVFNPNRQASLYYATGYQAGFVRISWMEFLKGDHQIK